MVSSSKKKRGKQRKAAKAQSSATHAPTVNNDESAGFIARTHIEDRILQNLLIQTLQKKVQCGHEAGTLALLTSFNSSTPGSLCVCVTVVPDVLNFLKRCEDETFDQVMASVGGDLVTPSTWIKLLFQADINEPSCTLQIVENIGPLVRCMVNDTERLFFKSNAHWRQGIAMFTGLIHNIIMSDAGSYERNNHIVQVLLEQHEGILRSIIQWGYWNDEYRPDIIQVLDGNNCAYIVDKSRNSTNQLLRCAFQMKAGNGDLAEEGTSLLTAIATTPIVNKGYDPACMVSYTAGVIRQAKIDKTEHFTLLPRLVDCVDKGVITDMIDLGLNFTTEYERALDVAHMSYRMILERSDMTKNRPSDTRTSVAIRAGLIEMCLNFIECFVDHSAFGIDAASMYVTLEHTLTHVHSILLHEKTAKAIRSKRIMIEERLLCLEQNANITNSADCKDLLDMVKSILDINGSYCCRCNKSLSKTEVKLCNGCGCMVYCSKACQKEDWLNGHKITCCKSYTDEISGRFQGRAWPSAMPKNERAASKLKELEINMNMIQLKLFLENSETILRQAEALDMPLYNCIIWFDLRKCPYEVDVKMYTDVYTSPNRKKNFEETRSKENITCTFQTFIDKEMGDGDTPILAMRRLFPHKWLVKQTKEEGRY